MKSVMIEMVRTVMRAAERDQVYERVFSTLADRHAVMDFDPPACATGFSSRHPELAGPTVSESHLMKECCGDRYARGACEHRS